MEIKIPEFALVALVGVSGSGKSTFARKHFRATEVLSSDFFRGLVSDDENDQSATSDAFDVLHYVAGKRLACMRLTVVDATNVQPEARRSILKMAREHHALAVAIVLNVGEKVAAERNRTRLDRQFGGHVIRNQESALRRSLRKLKEEGFRYIYVLNSPEEVDKAVVIRQRLWTDRRDDSGPFDIIGDIHGCYDELRELLGSLGYAIDQAKLLTGEVAVVPPEGRRAFFVGDLVDRGPASPDVLRLVMNMVRHGQALCVPGNHEVKLYKWLSGKSPTLTHGLAETVAQMERESPEFRREVADFIDSLVSHFVLDGGKLIVAHAGMSEKLQGRSSGRVRAFALYGDTTGEKDEFGVPVRYPWALEYRGKAMVVYGHTPVVDAEWLNNTICIDTGCVFGGKLTALRYPERELLSVAAKRTYYEPIRPPIPPTASLGAQHIADDTLELDDVIGKRRIETRLLQSVTVREENAAAALEIMSRFAVNPKWLVHLPPTMSPSETTEEPGFLEHPKEALDYFRKQGLEKVVCEQKHMGSRAILVVCRNEAVATARFGVSGEGIGAVYTRTGRPFFSAESLEQAVLQRIATAIDGAGLWEALATDWVILDAEVMPWSMKALELLRQQYAATGAAAEAMLGDANAALAKAVAAGVEVGSLVSTYVEREKHAHQFIEAYRRYCWDFKGIDDLKVAPFHLLASEGATHFDKLHSWHMEMGARIAAADRKLLMATPYRVVVLTEAAEVQSAIQWWHELTDSGMEGFVVKPLEYVARGKRGMIQPAIKCRGREYLRIIYGADYDHPDNLTRLRERGLSRKRALALRELALGIEALERFVARKPLRFVHECVFGVLASESEPVDPRL